MDDKYVISVAGALYIFESSTLEMQFIEKGEPYYSCAVSTNGKYFVAGTKSGSIKIFDFEKFTLYKSLAGHSVLVWALKYSSDGKFLISSSTDYTLKVFDSTNFNELATLKGHTGSVTNCDTKLNLIASTSTDSSIKLWGTNSFQEIATLKGHADWTRGCCFLKKSDVLFSVSYDGKIKAWDLSNCTEIYSFQYEKCRISSCAISNDDKYLYICVGNNLKVFEIFFNGVNNVIQNSSVQPMEFTDKQNILPEYNIENLNDRLGILEIQLAERNTQLKKMELLTQSTANLQLLATTSTTALKQSEKTGIKLQKKVAKLKSELLASATVIQELTNANNIYMQEKNIYMQERNAYIQERNAYIQERDAHIQEINKLVGETVPNAFDELNELEVKLQSTLKKSRAKEK